MSPGRGGEAGRLRALGRDALLRLELQLGSRLVLFAALDAILLLMGIFEALLSDAEPRDFYFRAVLLTPLLIGLPALADLVALERTAGSLDLALATPEPERYFVRRAASVCALLAAQSALTLLALWLSEGFSFPLVPPLVSAVTAVALLGAAALFWAVRVETSGAVWFATLATLLALGRWYFANPIPGRDAAPGNPFFAPLPATLSWLGDQAVLLAAASLLYVYARRRLANPERLLT